MCLRSTVTPPYFRSLDTLCPGCYRNRQVMAFYHTIKWFDPGFVLMENVLDIFKKQNGMYVKMAATTLLGMDYQTRTGVIAAAHQGAPQGRWRCVPSLPLLNPKP